MDPFTLAFVPGGRIGRLNYFLVFLALFLVSLLALIVMIFTVGFSILASGNPGAAGMGMAMGMTFLSIVALYLVSQYVSVVVTVKRLHDIGLSGWHAAWIYAIGLLDGILLSSDGIVSSLLGVLLGLVWLGAWIWLQATPGEATANEYGYAPS